MVKLFLLHLQVCTFEGYRSLQIINRNEAEGRVIADPAFSLTVKNICDLFFAGAHDT
jgi:hypothetical protein